MLSRGKTRDTVALIRADGTKKIGMGHLMRSCLVSKMLQTRFGMKTILIMKDNSDARKFLSARGIDTAILPSSIPCDEEISTLRKIVDDRRPRLFFLDILENDTNAHYTASLKESGCPLVAITDDSHRRIIDAHIVLNGNPNQLDHDYSSEKARYLKGPRYFLMDPAYGSSEVGAPKKDVKKILLTLGGSDHNDLLFRVLDVLKRIRQDLFILIVTTRSTGYVERLQKYLKIFPLSHELIFDAKSLVSLWSLCDVAITAGGNTLFERIAIRLPGVTLCQLDRQMEIADRFESMGVNVNLGFGSEISDDKLSQGLHDFISQKGTRESQFQMAPEIVDGKGIQRFGDEIEFLLGGTQG